MEEEYIEYPEEYYISDEDKEYGNILYRISQIADVPYWKIKALNPDVKRSDIILGNVTVITLAEPEEED